MKYIGVEIGGTKQQICVGNERGEISLRKAVKLGEIHERVTATEILAWIEEVIDKLINEYEIAGIGVGFGGPLELETGCVLSSLQVDGWENFHLRRWFESRWDVPVCVANDTFTGGIGELYAGAGIGADRLFYTNIGTGIGGGLYVNGKGYDGCGFGAAYLGNTLVPDWRSNLPGDYTRMELLVSGKSISERLEIPGYVPEDSLLIQMCGGDLSQLDARMLGDAVRAKDGFGIEELDRITESFSIALANALAMSGVTKVVIGGGVAKMGIVLFDRIREKTAELAFIANRGRYEIVPSKLMDDAVLVGALVLASGAEKLIIV